MNRIETERLILRPFFESDYDDLFEFLSQRKDDEFEAYPNINYENGHEHLSYRLNSNEFIAIELKESKKVIGNIYFGNRDFDAKELGYIINKNYQRKGYAFEAISELLENAKNIHRIYAECDPLNESSWRLLEKIGFEREAHFKKNVYFFKDEKGNPIWKDTYVYAYLVSDK